MALLQDRIELVYVADRDAHRISTTQLCESTLKTITKIRLTDKSAAPKHPQGIL